MLSAEAYSFRLKSRLAISLSWIAGFTNVVTLIACDQVVSHQTGNATHLGMELGGIILRKSGSFVHAVFFGWLVAAFLCGAISSAFMTEGARRAGRASKYILPMSVEGVLLSMLTILLIQQHKQSALMVASITGIAAFAMGLQNATITKISGAIVRTTHLTGVITDLGLEGVQLLLWWRDMVYAAKAHRMGRTLKISRRHPSLLRVLLLLSILGSFLFGATAGSVLYIEIGASALLAPVLFLTWIVMIDFFTPIADVKEIDPTKDKELIALFGNITSMLPPEVGIFRLAHHKINRPHQAPDFGTWVDRVPPRWRVIILVISPLTHFDTDTAASLLSAARKLKGRDRTLVISGMNRVQFKSLVDCGLTKVIDLDNFVPDLEFAVARGINLAGNSNVGIRMTNR